MITPHFVLQILHFFIIYNRNLNIHIINDIHLDVKIRDKLHKGG